jgi:hypothetical protein
VQEPDEEELRDLARKLGTVKKETMALNRGLVVGQPAIIATKANELASEAWEAIKASQETIRAALRGMGAASDISEISGPTGAPRLPPARPARGSLAPPAWAPRGEPAAPAWLPQSTPATSAWPPPDMPLRPTSGGVGDEQAVLMQGLMSAQANDSGWPTFNGKYAEYPETALNQISCASTGYASMCMWQSICMKVAVYPCALGHLQYPCACGHVVMYPYAHGCMSVFRI